MNRLTWTVATATLLLCACAGSRPPAGSSPPDLAGGWTFQVAAGKNLAQGALSLVAEGPQYRGTLTTDQGSNVLPVRSLALQGAALTMVVESPNGLVTFSGVLHPDARSFLGTVTYHNGQSFPMAGRRR